MTPTHELRNTVPARFDVGNVLAGSTGARVLAGSTGARVLAGSTGARVGEAVRDAVGEAVRTDVCGLGERPFRCSNVRDEIIGRASSSSRPVLEAGVTGSAAAARPSSASSARSLMVVAMFSVGTRVEMPAEDRPALFNPPTRSPETSHASPL